MAVQPFAPSDPGEGGVRKALVDGCALSRRTEGCERKLIRETTGLIACVGAALSRMLARELAGLSVAVDDCSRSAKRELRALTCR